MEEYMQVSKNTQTHSQPAHMACTQHRHLLAQWLSPRLAVSSLGLRALCGAYLHTGPFCSGSSLAASPPQRMEQGLEERAAISRLCSKSSKDWHFWAAACPRPPGWTRIKGYGGRRGSYSGWELEQISSHAGIEGALKLEGRAPSAHKVTKVDLRQEALASLCMALGTKGLGCIGLHQLPAKARFRFTRGDLQPDCPADRPVTGPRQSP
eukprot:929098-Pelagomonas_calceolata.AAC.1